MSNFSSDKANISIGCVVMAAGNAKRFGKNKLAAMVNGKTLIEHALDAVPTNKISMVCVVTQYDEVEDLAKQHGFHCVRNHHPEDGISHTLFLGTRTLSEQCKAILYLVSDQPLLRRESVTKLINFYCLHPDHIVSAAHDGKRGNPCIFPQKYFPELCSLTGDVGGSAVIRVHQENLLLCEMSAEELMDVDTGKALKDLREKSSVC